MAQQLVNLGGAANDGTGDPLRNAFAKLNANIAELYTGVGTGGSSALSPFVSSNALQISAFTGVDKTGVTDSRNALANAVAQAAAAGQWLIIDAPLKITIGTDHTKPIFIPSRSRIAWTGKGKITTDNLCTNLFVFQNVTDVILQDPHIEWSGSFGTQSIDTNFGPMVNVPFNTHNITITDNLVNTYVPGVSGNSFTGGATSLWSGPAPYNTMFNIRGAAQRITVNNLRIGVAIGATADQFISTVINMTSDWLPGTVVTTSTPQNSSTVTQPQDIVFNNPVLDGFCMGFLGSAKVVLNSPTFKRYSDLQDGTTGTVTFNAGLSSGVSSATLAAPWALKTGIYALTLSNAQLVYTTLTNGSTSTGSFLGQMNFTANLSAAATSGTLTGWAYGNGTFPVAFSKRTTVNATGLSAQSLAGNGDGDTRTVTVSGTAATWTGGLSANMTNKAIATVATTSGATATATSGNMGGVGNWSAPPHALYMTFPTGTTYPYQVIINSGLDMGPYVGLPTRRSTTSGTICSLKVDADGFNSVDGYTCYRPDGMMDLTTAGSIYGASFRNMTGFYDSSVATANAGTIFNWRYPASIGYTNLDLANITLYDLNPAPIAMPMLNSSNAGNANCSFKNIRQFLPDFGTGFPQFYFSGSNIEFEGSIFFTNYSAATTSRGVYATPATVPNLNSTFYFKVYGWHQAPITFTGAIASGDTSATMTVAWPYGNGTFLFTFSNYVQRYVTFSSSTTAVTWTTGLGAAATINAVAGNFLAANYGGWKMRSGVNTTHGNFGNKAQVIDVSNNLVMDYDTARCRETWTQQERIVVPTGVTATLHMTIASTMLITDYSIFCVTAAGTSLGVTSVNVGWSGSTAALITGAPITANASPFTPPAAVSTGGSNRTILLTAVGGTGFDGTGEFMVSVTAVQSVITI